jgi:hypothetical protein
MRKRVVSIFLRSLALGFLGAVSANAQPGVEISLPPNSHQTGQFTFANSCPTNQRFRVAAQPPAEWLQFDSPAVDVTPGNSFDFRFTVSTFGKIQPGNHRSSLVVVCTSCAGSDPPCLQTAQELPVSLTVGTTRSPGGFENTPSPAAATPSAIPEPSGSPTGAGGNGQNAGAATSRPSTTPGSPPASTPGNNVLIPFAAGGLLFAGVAGGLLVARAKAASKPATAVGGAPGSTRQPNSYPVETERHQVRR